MGAYLWSGVMSFGADDTIDRGHMIAPHQQLVAILRARIERGDYRPGRAIPSVAQLVQEFDLGRDTVRKAIKVLEDEEIVVVIASRGVFVSEDYGQA